MQYKRIRLGPLSLLVVRPLEGGYGHLGVAILNGLLMARATRSWLYVRRPALTLNDEIFRLRSDVVPLVSESRLLNALMDRPELMEFLSDPLEYVRRVLTSSSLDKSNSRRFRNLTLFLLDRLPPQSPPSPPFFGVDLRYGYARSPLRVRFPHNVERLAARRARDLGIDPDRPIVTLHVREAGYRPSVGLAERPIDDSRNARIESYFEAIDALVARGFTVVRVGDPTMTPVARPGVVDLATSAQRDELAELWCLLHSRFFIGCESGVYSTCLLVGVPCLHVNGTNPVGAYPARARDRAILKRAVDVKTGRLLTVSDMLTEEFLYQRKDEGRYRFLDNSPQDILEAVEEMLAADSGREAPTPLQLEYADRVRALQASDRILKKYKSKGQSGPFYLGDGRIARGFVERYMHSTGGPLRIQEECG